MGTRTTPGDLREVARLALIEPGKRRKRAWAKIQELDDEMRPLVIAAHKAEVPYRVIREITGISQATIRKWTKEAAEASERP